MFDTSIVKAHAISAPRRTTLMLSVVIHTAVAAAAIALTLVTTEIPKDPPKQMQLFRAAELPSVPPPPKGRPDGSSTPKQQKSTPKPVQPLPVPQQDVVPQTIPQTTDIVSQQTPADATATGPDDGAKGPIGRKDGCDGCQGPIDGPPADAVPSTMPYTAGVGGVTKPAVIRKVEPRFPPAFSRAVTNATVVVQCVIDRNGDIQNMQIMHSSFPPFNDAVLTALQQWKFAPGKLHGQPVDTYFELTVNFRVMR
jgi:protein TonB